MRNKPFDTAFGQAQDKSFDSFSLLKAQAMLIYAGVIAIVITALIIISGYVQQRVQGSYKQAGDSLGMGELKD